MMTMSRKIFLAAGVTIALLSAIEWWHPGLAISPPPPPHDGPPPKIIVSCVGDSITASGCASSPKMTYVAQLQQILGEAKYAVTNYGVSGQTMMKDGYCDGDAEHCGGNCSYWQSPRFLPALHSNPDIVTIMLGTNDAKGCNWYGPPNGSPPGMGVEYRHAYLEMISLFRNLPSKPKVYLLIPPPLVNPPEHPHRPPPYNMTKRVINELFPGMISTVAVETAVDGVVDLWSALGGEVGYQRVDMTCDGCHPKDPAMTIMAQTIARAIAPVEYETSR